MRLLFIHQNLPGQYRHLLSHYAKAPDVEVVGLGEARRIRANFPAAPDGVRLVGYEMPGGDTSPSPSPGIGPTAEAVRRGRAVLMSLLRLKSEGFTPDVICAHPGWGETMFVKDVFPGSRLIHYCEFYYRSHGQDFGFDPEFPVSVDDVLGLRTRNFHHLLAAEQADEGVSPTQWQKSRFPDVFHQRISVVHDGVDSTLVAPDRRAFIEFPHLGIRLSRDDEVITYVTRNLEPYRGFHKLMQALPDVLRRRPKARVVIVGGDEVSYGRRLAQGTYRDLYLGKYGHEIDLTRVHFVGKVPYHIYLKILQVSSAHIYLTYPFVLSWSLMEAMAAGCLVIGSRTAPVEEVIRHGDNGLLVDFFATDELADTVVRSLDLGDAAEAMRCRARQDIVSTYDLMSVCLPAHRNLIERGDGQPGQQHVSRAG